MVATTKAKEPEKIFARRLGTDMVILTVGEEKKEFKIHKELLCSTSTVFEKMFDGRFEEGKKMAATLPEDHVDGFEIFVSWVYTGSWDTSSLPSTSIRPLIHLFCFAEKYGIFNLMDNTMDFIASTLKTRNLLPAVDDIDECYANTYEGSKLRVFMAKCYVYIILKLKEDHAQGLWKKELMHELANKHSDLLLDVLGSMRGSALDNFSQGDPREGRVCDYHQHVATTACPYRYKLNAETGLVVPFGGW